MSTFIAEVVAFLIILVILARWRPSLPITLPTIRAALAEQQEMITQQVEDAEEAKRRLAEAERAYQNALHEARTEAAQIRENARAEAQRTVEDLRTQAQEESGADRRPRRGAAASQRASIVRELRGRDRHAGRRAVGEDRRPAAGRRGAGVGDRRRVPRRPRVAGQGQRRCRST